MAERATADGVALTSFAAQHVSPIFKAASARKRGRRYEFANAHGDQVWFDLWSRGWGDGAIGFDAGWTLAPRPLLEYRQWRLREQGVTDVVVTDQRAWLVSAGVLPPPEVELDGHWGFFDATSADRCGAVLAGRIEDEVLPALRTALDRRAVLEHLDSGVSPWTWATGFREENRVLLLLDEGPGPELDAALDALERTTADPRFRDDARELLRWARGRLARDLPAVAGDA